MDPWSRSVGGRLRETGQRGAGLPVNGLQHPSPDVPSSTIRAERSAFALGRDRGAAAPAGRPCDRVLGGRFDRYACIVISHRVFERTDILKTSVQSGVNTLYRYWFWIYVWLVVIERPYDGAFAATFVWVATHGRDPSGWGMKHRWQDGRSGIDRPSRTPDRFPIDLGGEDLETYDAVDRVATGQPVGGAASERRIRSSIARVSTAVKPYFR